MTAEREYSMGARGGKPAVKAAQGQIAAPAFSNEEDIAPKRVLLGVADAGMRRVLASPLRAEGFEVVEAGDVSEVLGALALSLLQSGRWYEPVDAIVCDAREDTSLLDAIEKLRDAGWNTPVIVLADQGDQETAERARGLGASAVFHPPFHAVDLRNAVRRMAKH